MAAWTNDAMSETHDDPVEEEEPTNPSVALPSERPAASVASGPPRSSPPPLPAAPTSRAPAASSSVASRPLSSPASSPAPPLPRRPSALPPSSPGSLRSPSALPPPPRVGVAAPASARPSELPRPSDPPSTEGGVLLRQRIVQLENVLEVARQTLDDQRETIASLTAELELLTVSLDAMSKRLTASEGQREEAQRALTERVRAEQAAEAEALAARLTELETALPAREPARALDAGSPELARQLIQLEARLRALEEGGAEARIRMRLDRQAHRLDELERRVPELETAQRATGDALAGVAQASTRHDERLGRLDSLFDELADEVREDREALDLAGLRARLDDLEALVLRTGTEEGALRRQLGEQERSLVALRELLQQVERIGLAAGAAPAPEEDLTRIKGIGPKYATMLREVGVATVAAIAGWTDEDLERAAAHLGIPAARVRKAGWVESARRLLE